MSFYRFQGRMEKVAQLTQLGKRKSEDAKQFVKASKQEIEQLPPKPPSKIVKPKVVAPKKKRTVNKKSSLVYDCIEDEIKTDDIPNFIDEGDRKQVFMESRDYSLISSLDEIPEVIGVDIGLQFCALVGGKKLKDGSIRITHAVSLHPGVDADKKEKSLEKKRTDDDSLNEFVKILLNNSDFDWVWKASHYKIESQHPKNKPISYAFFALFASSLHQRKKQHSVDFVSAEGKYKNVKHIICNKCEICKNASSIRKKAVESNLKCFLTTSGQGFLLQHYTKLAATKKKPDDIPDATIVMLDHYFTKK